LIQLKKKKRPSPNTLIIRVKVGDRVNPKRTTPVARCEFWVFQGGLGRAKKKKTKGGVK